MKKKSPERILSSEPKQHPMPSDRANHFSWGVEDVQHLGIEPLLAGDNTAETNQKKLRAALDIDTLG